MAQRGRPPGSKNVQKPKEDIMSDDEIKKKLEELDRIKQELEELKTNSQGGMKDEFDEFNIRQEEYIKVISLYPDLLILSTRADGSGKRFAFKGFGEVKRILYSDLVEIMESHADYTDFLREGYYYIADSRVVRRHGLDEVYSNFLTKEVMEKIIAGDQKEVISIFESAGDTQKKFVCDLVISRLANGEEIDLNVVDRLSRISGIDIQGKANEAKQYSEMIKK